MRMYKYRLYPSRVQQDRLYETFNACKETYNELLELNINAYKDAKKGVTTFGFNKHLRGKYTEVFSQVLQNVSYRVSKSFQNFFRRVKEGAKKKGFPRFKSCVRSITYPQNGFKFTSDKRLYCSKIGNIPLVLHRTPKGKVKTLTIKRNHACQWFAVFSCEVEPPKVEHKGGKVGVDVGLENYATLSDGTVIANPRHLIKSEHRLARLQRSLSRKVKGSNNRKEARFKVARLHQRIDDQRGNFLHKLSHSLTQKYKTISVENLNIKGMVQNHHLAKHIHDASWARFALMLSYKAVTCGGEVIYVNPRNTSRTCSNCGNVMNMPLCKRLFTCSVCGLVCARDLNAASNIGRAGLARTHTPVDSRPPRQARKPAIRPLVEAGTTCDRALPQVAVAGSPQL
jgi:putative transposase